MAEVTRRVRVEGEVTREAQVKEWVLLKRRIDTETKRLNQIRDHLMSVAAAEGEEDEKGSLFLAFDPVTAGGQTYSTIKRERRVSVSLLSDKVETLADKKDLRDRLYKMVPVLDQDELYVLNQEGKITDRELDSLFEEKETWAFKVLAE